MGVAVFVHERGTHGLDEVRSADDVTGEPQFCVEAFAQRALRPHASNSRVTCRLCGDSACKRSRGCSPLPWHVGVQNWVERMMRASRAVTVVGVTATGLHSISPISGWAAA